MRKQESLENTQCWEMFEKFECNWKKILELEDKDTNITLQELKEAFTDRQAW